jgi:BON domain
MRRYVFRLAILALAVIGPSVVRADDQEIAQQIVQKLQAHKQAGTLKGFSIDLSVEEGTVWMSGHVADEDQQMAALDVARRIPGVTQVVNDLSIQTPSATAARRTHEVFGKMSKALTNAVRREEPVIQLAAATTEVDAQTNGAIGSGVAQAPTPARVATARPVAQSAPPAGAQPSYYGHPGYAQPVPVYAGSHQQVPLAIGQARTGNMAVQHEGAIEGMPGAPVPMYAPGSAAGVAPARYDHPSMPGYAWPSYAAYPNYAAVTYPKQYSPTAWPYIGPFYPYPQVPLGWRKVTLEWDDGWWMLDFKQRRTMYNH